MISKLGKQVLQLNLVITVPMVLFFVALVVVLMTRTSGDDTDNDAGPIVVTTGFISALQVENYATAWSHVSPDAAGSCTRREFEDVFRDLAVVGHADSGRSMREIRDGGAVVMAGHVETVDSLVAYELVLSRHGTDWMIDRLTFGELVLPIAENTTQTD